MMARAVLRFTITPRHWRPDLRLSWNWPCSSRRERAIQTCMNVRLLAVALTAIAISTPVAAQAPDRAAVARASGTPEIPGLKMVWLAPWGEVSKAHPWRNIIVHQTEGPAGSARGGAEAQAKNPTRPVVTFWVEPDHTET